MKFKSTNDKNEKPGCGEHSGLSKNKTDNDLVDGRRIAEKFFCCNLKDFLSLPERLVAERKNHEGQLQEAGCHELKACRARVCSNCDFLVEAADEQQRGGQDGD